VARQAAKDEATIVDLVEAEDLELATDMMVPYAHWITPTFAPQTLRHLVLPGRGTRGPDRPA
jgi:hypothetical protein